MINLIRVLLIVAALKLFESKDSPDNAARKTRVRACKLLVEDMMKKEKDIFERAASSFRNEEKNSKRTLDYYNQMLIVNCYQEITIQKAREILADAKKKKLNGSDPKYFELFGAGKDPKKTDSEGLINSMKEVNTLIEEIKTDEEKLKKERAKKQKEEEKRKQKKIGRLYNKEKWKRIVFREEPKNFFSFLSSKNFFKSLGLNSVCGMIIISLLLIRIGNIKMKTNLSSKKKAHNKEPKENADKEEEENADKKEEENTDKKEEENADKKEEESADKKEEENTDKKETDKEVQGEENQTK